MPAPNAQPAGSTPFARDTTALSQTDSLRYHLTRRGERYEGTAMVTFRNTTPDTAYFIHCNDATGVQLQRDVSGTWVSVWTSMHDACHSAPIVVAPGDTLRRAVPFLDGYQPEPGDSASPTREPGTYRLVWVELVRDYNRELPYSRDVAVDPSLPLAQRVTNRFLLTGAPR